MLLRKWQKLHGRHGLAWQSCDSNGFRDPYRVWLSEVMLQQTQVKTVVAYFDRFLEKFPNVFALANASQEDVFAVWTGLGYYRRARFLHECAKKLVAEHDGIFPSDLETLESLPGIGKNTAAAIASFCFGLPVTIFDGNVERVASRFFCFQEDLSSSKNQKILRSLAQTLVPSDPLSMPWHTQGLMDLGATVCRPKKALCDLCPLSGLCVTKTRGFVDPEDLPHKTKKTKRAVLENAWLWLECEDRVWLQKRPLSGVWGGLWSLPILSMEDARLFFDNHSLLVKSGKSFKHVLTHRDWIFHPVSSCIDRHQAASVTEDSLLTSGRWMDKNEWMNLGVSGPTKAKLVCWQGDMHKKRLETAS